MPRWLRVVWFGATAMAVWLFAVPAYAQRGVAPLCDDRGATRLMPLPNVAPPSSSIDLGEPTEAQRLDELFARGTYEHRAPEPTAAPDFDACLPATTTALVVVKGEGVLGIFLDRDGPSGVRVRLERPPRRLAQSAS
jgi:hypothetical protein